MCVFVCVVGREGWVWADSLMASVGRAPLARGGATQLGHQLQVSEQWLHSPCTEHVVCETPSSRRRRACTPQSERRQRVEMPLGKGGEQLSWGGHAGDCGFPGAPFAVRLEPRVAGRAGRAVTTEASDPLLLLQLLLSRFSRVRLCATPWTAAHQAPLSMGLSRQEIGVGCHFLLQLMSQGAAKERR